MILWAAARRFVAEGRPVPRELTEVAFELESALLPRDEVLARARKLRDEADDQVTQVPAALAAHFDEALYRECLARGPRGYRERDLGLAGARGRA